MAELKLSLGLEKLIEVVAQGVGALAKPWMIRRVAAADADRLTLLAGTHLEIADKLQLPEHTAGIAEEEIANHSTEIRMLASGLKSGDLSAASEVFERVEQRQMQRESRRQRNIEAIALGAAKSISDDVSQEPVDEDWVARFFDGAQEVSNPKLQQLWSSILAREVAVPRTTSVRTLEALKNISSQEAVLFQESLRCVCQADDDLFFIAVANTLPLDNRHILNDCGMFGLEGRISIHGRETLWCTHGGIRIGFSPSGERAMTGLPWHISIIRLSVAGRSIADVCWRPSDPNTDFLRGLLREYGKYFNIEAQYGDRTMSLQDFLQGALTGSE